MGLPPGTAVSTLLCRSSEYFFEAAVRLGQLLHRRRLRIHPCRQRLRMHPGRQFSPAMCRSRRGSGGQLFAGLFSGPPLSHVRSEEYIRSSTAPGAHNDRLPVIRHRSIQEIAFLTALEMDCKFVAFQGQCSHSRWSNISHSGAREATVASEHLPPLIEGATGPVWVHSGHTRRRIFSAFTLAVGADLRCRLCRRAAREAAAA
jgi:hypothetical protein